MHLAADPELARMIDHHVLDDLDPLGVGGVDEILVGRPGRLQTWVDAGPVVGMVAVVVEPGAVLHRGRDPDGGEAEIGDVVQSLHQSLEVAAPVGVDGLAVGIEADAVATEEVVARVPVVETGGDQEIDGLLAKVVTLLDGPRRALGLGPGRGRVSDGGPRVALPAASGIGVRMGGAVVPASLGIEPTVAVTEAVRGLMAQGIAHHEPGRTGPLQVQPMPTGAPGIGDHRRARPVGRRPRWHAVPPVDEQGPRPVRGTLAVDGQALGSHR